MSDESLQLDELRAATLKGLRWAILSRPIVESVGILSIVVLARLVAPAEFGRYAIALIVFDLGSVTGQGVGAAIVQRRAVSREHLQTGLFLAVLSGLVLVGLIVLAAQFIIVPAYGERTADLVRMIAPLSLLSAPSMVPVAILERRLEFRRLSTLSVVNTVVAASTAITLALAGLNGAALVLGLLAGTAAGTVLLWAWAMPPPPRLHRAAAKELLSYGAPAAVAAVGWVGFKNCDYAIVGVRLGALQVGLYYRAYTIGVEYQKKVSQLVGTLGFPLLSRAQGPEEQGVLRGRMVRMETLVLFPALVLLAILAPVLIPWFFGHRWAPAVVPTQILALGGAATLVIDAVGAALMATGRGHAIMGYGWGHFVSYAVAVLIVAPLGITAVAVAAATVHTAFVFVAYVLLMKGRAETRIGRVSAAFKELWDDVRPATVSCLVLAGITVPLSIAMSSAHVPAVPYLAVVSLSGVAVYVGALRTFYPAALRSVLSLVRHVLPKTPMRGVARRLVMAGRTAA